MFEYFPANYNLSLAVCLALSMGGELNEMNQALQPLVGIGSDPGEAELKEWFDRWHEIGATAETMAAHDQASGYERSAARKHLRAATYYLMAERQMTNASPDKNRAYGDALRVFQAGVRVFEPRAQFVEVPYGEHTLPAIFLPADGAGQDAPCLIMFNGFDVTKEYLYLMGIPELARRGFSVLLCDQPGSGGALRLHGLPTRFDMEAAATACVDYLETRTDVDPDRIGLAGISMGGYFAPRAATFEKRIRACVAWCAVYDVERIAAHLAVAKTDSVPEFQIQWVFGRQDVREDPTFLKQFSLDTVIGDLTSHFLVMHGGDDRQVPVAQAHQMYEGAVKAASRELKIFEAGTWGDQHCQHDSATVAIDYLADWLSTHL